MTTDSTASTSALDKLLASFQSTETSTESEEQQRDAFARLISEEFVKGSMAAPSRNGHIRSLGEPVPSQTPVPLPNYTPQPPQRSVSASSASQMQTASASPAPSSTPVPAQISSPMGSLNKGPYQPPPTQNGIATPKQTSQQAQAPGPLHVSPGAQPQPENVEALNIYQAMSTLVERAPATAVRQVVRDKWEKTLLGSQYHIAFLVSWLLVGISYRY